MGAYSPEQAYFGDTILIWHPWRDSFFMPDFVRTCSEGFCGALEIGLHLRGTISFGAADMDNARRIYFGSPLVEAVEVEGAQKWVGVSIGPSVARPPFNNRIWPHGLIPYEAHYKIEFRRKLPGLVVDWPLVWRMEAGRGDAREVLRDLNADPTFAEYYERSIEFVDYSERNVGWEKRLAVRGDSVGTAPVP